jgi:hypothetical protein
MIYVCVVIWLCTETRDPAYEAGEERKRCEERERESSAQTRDQSVEKTNRNGLLQQVDALKNPRDVS